MNKMLENVKTDVKDSVIVRKAMTRENARYLKENADYIQDTSKKVNIDMVDRGVKYTLEINKPKVLKEIMCFNPQKNFLHMLEKAELSDHEKANFKFFKKSVDKKLDAYLDKNYYKTLYLKHKKETARTRLEESSVKKRAVNKKLSRSQAAKNYSMNSTKTFKRKQLLTSESENKKEIKSPKEEFLERLDQMINNIPNIISSDNLANFINLNKENDDLPLAYVDDYIFDKTKVKSEEEAKYLNLPKELVEKNISEYFPQLRESIDKFQDLKNKKNTQSILITEREDNVKRRKKPSSASVRFSCL